MDLTDRQIADAQAASQHIRGARRLFLFFLNNGYGRKAAQALASTAALFRGPEPRDYEDVPVRERTELERYTELARRDLTSYNRDRPRHEHAPTSPKKIRRKIRRSMNEAAPDYTNAFIA